MSNTWLFKGEMLYKRMFSAFTETFITGKCSKLKRAIAVSGFTYDCGYDLWLDGIKITLNSSRAINIDREPPVYTSENQPYLRALTRNTRKNFLMNFQQLKPQYCDVFIWVAVFRDEIVVWVMSSKEVVENPLYSKGQHRGNSGNEGQLHIKNDNIHVLNSYELRDDNIEIAIREAASRN